MNSYPDATGMLQSNGFPMTRGGAPVDSSSNQLTNGITHRKPRGVTPPARKLISRRGTDKTCYSDTEAMAHPRRPRSRSRSKQRAMTHGQTVEYACGCSECDGAFKSHCPQCGAHSCNEIKMDPLIHCNNGEPGTCACNMPNHCQQPLPGDKHTHGRTAKHAYNSHTHQCGRPCNCQQRESEYVYPCSDSEVKTREKSWATSRSAHVARDAHNHVTTQDMPLTPVKPHAQLAPSTAYRDMRTQYVTGLTSPDNAHARVQNISGFTAKPNVHADEHDVTGNKQPKRSNSCVHDVTVHSPQRRAYRRESDVTGDNVQTNISAHAAEHSVVSPQMYFQKAMQDFSPAKYQSNSHTPNRDVPNSNPRTNAHIPAHANSPGSHPQINNPRDDTEYKHQTNYKPQPNADNDTYDVNKINYGKNILPKQHKTCEQNLRSPVQNVHCVTAQIHEPSPSRIPNHSTHEQNDCETSKDKQQTDWNGVMQDLFYNLDVVDCTDPIETLDRTVDQTIDQTLEHTYDSSSGIASNTSTNKSTSKMSVFRGDNSSISSADKRYSDDSSFETRQFSDSSVSVDKQYVKKRQGEGKFPWAYTHGAKHAIKVARQNQTNKDRSAIVGTPRSPCEYTTPVISHKSPHPVDYNYNSRQSPLHVRFDILDLQDTEKLMFTSNKGKSKLPRPSHFDLMTDDVIVNIFSNLPTDQLCRCSCVSQRWYRLAWDPLLWKRIVLNDENIYVDRALKYLTKRLSYNTPTVCVIVEKINLSGCEKLTDKGLHYIAKRCPELRHLEIRGCANVTNTALFEVVSYCVNLEYLDVTGCERITNIRLTDSLLAQATAHHLRQIYLRYLDMSDCDALDDNGLVSISTYCSQLQFLFLRRCARIGDVGLSAICNNCSNLRELSISDCKRVTDYGVSEISKLGESLRYLSVAKCDKVSDVGIIQVARGCKKLRYVNVRGCEAVSDDSLDTIARNLSRLKSLDIGKCDVTDEGLMALAYCSQLKRLSVKSCDSITDQGIVTVAHGCRKLQQLNMQDCHVTLEAYRTVKKCCKRCLIEHTNPGFC